MTTLRIIDLSDDLQARVQVREGQLRLELRQRWADVEGIGRRSQVFLSIEEAVQLRSAVGDMVHLATLAADEHEPSPEDAFEPPVPEAAAESVCATPAPTAT